MLLTASRRGIDVDALMINGMRNDGGTPLFMASQNGHTNVVQLLIDAGATLNTAVAANGATAVIVASDYGKACRKLQGVSGKAEDFLTSNNSPQCSLLLVGFMYSHQRFHHPFSRAFSSLPPLSPSPLLSLTTFVQGILRR